ncbi:hypothetical protein B0J11DRAFT_428429 [Dendryphion nanum]|uniref:F-box domain-containing protein n=1 Tax=Dendryphion nanum TaxID=256645 RepID=A0A9P9ITJ0_9PLEO|nr:hypothetical protein B0J11DRAFT_428429 [Dendryphion nanum]
MPIELLTFMIAEYLSTQDFGHLRLTSKHFSTLLFDAFGREFFSKRQFMISKHSLDTLTAIAHHEALAPYMTHVIIGMEQFHNVINVGDSQLGIWRNAWAGQWSLLNSGLLPTMLGHVFSSLPNLKTISIRDYSAPGRFRDRGKWHSYGTPTIVQDSQQTLMTPRPDAQSDYTGQLFSTIIAALAQPDCTARVPSIEVITRMPRIGMGDFGFHIAGIEWSFSTAGSKNEGGIRGVIQGLEKLLLTLNLEAVSAPLPSMHAGPMEGFLATENVVRFLGLATGLKHLRLNFETAHRDPAAAVNARMIPALFEALADANRFQLLFPNLSMLDVGMVMIDHYQLFKVIQRVAPTLKALSLYKVTFQYHSSQYHDEDDLPNPLQAFLKDISGINNLALNRLDIGYTNQMNENRERFHIYFSTKSAFTNETERTGLACFKGDMKEFLPKAIADVQVGWPVVVPAPDPTTPMNAPGTDPSNDDDSDDEDGDDE